MIWPAVLLGVLVFTAAMIRERRADQTAVWRQGVILLMTLGLMILILQPRIEKAVDLQTALVLTPGASHHQVEAAGLSVGSDVLSVALPGVEPWSVSTQRPPDLSTFLRRNPQVHQLKIVGAGLEPWDLDGLSPAVELVESSSPGLGVAAVAWRRQVVEGDWLQVTGNVLGLSDEMAAVSLTGPGGVQSEVELKANSDDEPVPFTLQMRPPGTGHFLYRLALTASDDSEISREFVDVVVSPADQPRVLWLEDAPSFETKHVKRWLSDQGSELAIRSRVSRDRFRFEFHNLERFAIGRMDGDLLQRFDLLIAEQRAWERLTAAEKRAVMQAVSEMGLGVLVRLNPDRSEAGDQAWPLGFRGTRVADVDRLLVHVEGAFAGKASPVEIPPFELLLEPTMTPLFTDSQGRVLALVRPAKRGNVGVTLLRKTYPWVLEGLPEAQHSYWRRLIEALARPATGPAWSLPPGPILVDEPLAVDLEWEPLAGERPEARFGPIDTELARMALRQDPVIPARWSTRVWPESVGWHRLDVAGESLEFYVAPSDSWPGWRGHRRQWASRLAAQRPHRIGLDGSRTVVERPIVRLPFYLVFLIGLGMLWLDERRGSQRVSTATR